MIWHRVKEILIRSGLTLVATIVASIPLLLFLGVEHLTSPEGFWQKLVLYGFGLWILGIIQFILFICWIVALIFIWSIKD